MQKQNHSYVPLDTICGFGVRPGMYQINGAMEVAPGVVNFTIYSHYATACELLLFHRKEDKPYAVIPIPEHYRIGMVYSIMVFDLDIEEFEYAYRMDGPYNPTKGFIFDRTKYLLDPYAKAVTGQRVWGKKEAHHNHYKARVVKNDFDWTNVKQPLIPMEELVIYEMHVRGFTKDDSSGVEHPGTFAGVLEKMPYLKQLGVNCVEFMPVFEFDELRDDRTYEGEPLIDYWGYNTVSFFSPNTSYTSELEYNHEGNELKRVIKELNQNGIEVFLDVVFNHTAEGNQDGPFFSFKGIDNNIYYMLTPDGFYYNFSGCGNTLNCNHPIVQHMIRECLRYWVVEYRVDGFRFDLASILGRNEDGSPSSKPPLLQSLASDPILGNVKLIAEAWDAGGMYQVGNFPAFRRWAEWNGKYRDDLRSFLKGDEGVISSAVNRITGSHDLYSPELRGLNASVNFMNCHDGFTLYDMYAYSEKHNEHNGWDNTDGENNNHSWNCGVEGETDQQNIIDLRKRLIKNACAVLMMSRGTPMFLAGDEFCNTQFGNNNAYCQDNIISWLDWSRLEQYKDIHEFFCYMISFRRQHTIIMKDTQLCSMGLPCVNVFREDHNEHVLGIMYAGKNSMEQDEFIFVAINSYWEQQYLTLPKTPVGKKWFVNVNTFEKESILPRPQMINENGIVIPPRTVMILQAEHSDSHE